MKRNYIIPKPSQTSTSRSRVRLPAAPPFPPAHAIPHDVAPEIVDLGTLADRRVSGQKRKGDGIILIADDDESNHSDLEKEEEEEEGEELLVVLNSKVAGQQHYGGASSMRPGQHLAFRREPHNRYDRNAIEILHPGFTLKIGHIPAVLAKQLSPLIDSRDIKLEGQADFSQRNQFTTGVQLHLYGKRSLVLDPRFAFALPKSIRSVPPSVLPNNRFRPALELSGRATSSFQDSSDDYSPFNTNAARQQRLQNILAGMQEGLRSGANNDLFSGILSDNDPTLLPEYTGDLILKTELLPYQKQGLWWMIKMEHPEPPLTEQDKAVQLWVSREDGMKKQYWYNLASRDMTREPPKFGRGGILADEMGLGKTLTTIALITTDDTGDGVIAKPENPDEHFDDMTLIICPLSVISNWTDQLQTHIGKSKSKNFKWYVYHGSNKDITKQQLRKFDMVITTYQTLTSEYRPSNEGTMPSSNKSKTMGVLFGIGWRRVVLDEAHMIKNRKAKLARACTGLTAERRWCLTGTPIINSAADLGSMLEFLKVCQPLDQREQWSNLVTKMVKRSPADGGKILKVIVQSTALRRTKDMKFKDGNALVPLPELKFFTARVELDDSTRALYDEVSYAVSQAFRELVARGEAQRHYTSVLTFLLRLRQIACDPALCPQSFVDDVRQNKISVHTKDMANEGIMVDLTPEKIYELQAYLQKFVEEQNECAVCFDSCTSAVITPCRHVFCKPCILESLARKPECPMDRGALSARQLIDLPLELTHIDQSLSNEQQLTGVYSAKTRRLIEFLRSTESGVKTLVFSQWTSHLNRVQMALAESGIPTCKLDGSMSQKTRERTIAEFSTTAQPDTLDGKQKVSPAVMLISLKAGAVGINLTVASQVVLLDPWWQSAIEQQAIDRVHRIGQTRPVRVIQMVASGTVEDKVLDIQKRKEKIISDAFDTVRGTGSNRDRNRVTDLATLFGVRLEHSTV